MGSELLTIKEIAGELSLPESTLRKYRDLFINYLPYVGSGRMKKYRGQAVEIFEQIRELRMDQHLSWRDIETRIAESYPRNTDGESLVASVSDNDEIVRYLQDVFENRISAMEKGIDRLEFVVTSVAQELIELRKVIADNARQTKETHVLLKEQAAVDKNSATTARPVNENMKGMVGNSAALNNRQLVSETWIAQEEKGRAVSDSADHVSMKSGAEIERRKMGELQKEIIDARLQLAGYRKRNEALEQEIQKLRNSHNAQPQNNSERIGSVRIESEKGQGPDHYPTNARKGKRFFGGNR